MGDHVGDGDISKAKDVIVKSGKVNAFDSS